MGAVFWDINKRPSGIDYKLAVGCLSALGKWGSPVTRAHIKSYIRAKRNTYTGDCVLLSRVMRSRRTRRRRHLQTSELFSDLEKLNFESSISGCHLVLYRENTIPCQENYQCKFQYWSRLEEKGEGAVGGPGDPLGKGTYRFMEARHPAKEGRKKVLCPKV